MSIRRLLPFILLNIVVSAVVVLALLYWWDSRQPGDVPANAAPDTVLATPIAADPDLVAESPALPEVEETAESGPPVYIVQRGDTLGTISQEFDLTVEELMEANGLTDPNFLQVNQELIIPSDEPAETGTPTPTPTSEPVAVPSPIPTEEIGGGEAQVNLVEVVGAGDLEREAVIIGNAGDRPIALLGWRLSDDAGITYTFGQVTLFGDGAAISLHSTGGQDGPSDLYWDLDEAIWQTDDIITLFDAEGTTRSTLQVVAP